MIQPLLNFDALPSQEPIFFFFLTDSTDKSHCRFGSIILVMRMPSNFDWGSGMTFYTITYRVYKFDRLSADGFVELESPLGVHPKSLFTTSASNSIERRLMIDVDVALVRIFIDGIGVQWTFTACGSLLCVV